MCPITFIATIQSTTIIVIGSGSATYSTNATINGLVPGLDLLLGDRGGKTIGSEYPG